MVTAMRERVAAVDVIHFLDSKSFIIVGGSSFQSIIHVVRRTMPLKDLYKNRSVLAHHSWMHNGDETAMRSSFQMSQPLGQFMYFRHAILYHIIHAHAATSVDVKLVMVAFIVDRRKNKFSTVFSFFFDFSLRFLRYGHRRRRRFRLRSSYFWFCFRTTTTKTVFNVQSKCGRLIGYSVFLSLPLLLSLSLLSSYYQPQCTQSISLLDEIIMEKKCVQIKLNSVQISDNATKE